MSQPSPPLDLMIDYFRVKVVRSFDELVSTRFAGGVNALCWPRRLEGDFNEVVERLSANDDMSSLDEASLRGLQVSAAGREAVNTLIEDHRRLSDLGLSPVLDCIRRYPRDEDGPVSTDVYSWHADSATGQADTYLCSYTEAASEGLRNEEAKRCVDIPETRAELLKLYGGNDDDGFFEFLKDNCFDLHYAAQRSARPFSFGLGNLWRIAIQYPGSPVPPCIHRAPTTVAGRPPRLLLIS